MDGPEVIKKLNPNSRERPGGVAVDGIVIHSMGEWINLPDGPSHAAEFLTEEGLSAHALIDPEGHILLCVPDSRVAFHAGISRFQGRKNLNDSFLGVELLVGGRKTSKNQKGSLKYYGFRRRIDRADCYSEAQYRSLAYLCRAWELRHPAIKVARMVGHCEVSGDDVRGPGKGKRDPGKAFDKKSFMSWLTRWRQEPEEKFKLPI